MARRFAQFLPLLLTVILLGLGAAWLLGAFSDGDDSEVDTLSGSRKDEDPVLVGASPPPPAPSPYAAETDLAKLVPAHWVGNDAQARILELAQLRPDLVSELVEWMRPERDADRVPKQAAGAQYSGPLTFGLLSLRDTLARLTPASVDALIAALDDADPEFRRRVAESLGAMGKDAVRAVDALLARLEPGAEDVVGQATMLRALGALGVGSDAVLAVFHAYVGDNTYPDDARAAAAESFLGLSGPSEAAFETCRAALQDQSYEVCTRLVPAIGALGADAAPLVPALLAIVQDPMSHERVRGGAVAALGEIGVPNSRLVMALVDVAMEERNEDWHRGAALRSLLSLGPEAVDAVFKFIESGDDATRLTLVSWVVRAQGAGGRVAERLLGVLDHLRSSDAEGDRVSAITQGSRAQVGAGVLVPWLSRWMTDANESVRSMALSYMARIPDATGAVVRALLAGLEDDSQTVLMNAQSLLTARVGSDHGDREVLRSPAVVEAMAAGLDDPHQLIRLQAATFLAYAAPDRAAEVVPVFIEIVESGQGAWNVLGPLHALGTAAQEAIPALEKAIAAEKNEYLRRALEGTLAAVKGE